MQRISQAKLLQSTFHSFVGVNTWALTLYKNPFDPLPIYRWIQLDQYQLKRKCKFQLDICKRIKDNVSIVLYVCAVGRLACQIVSRQRPKNVGSMNRSEKIHNENVPL